ncbi:MAG: phosphate-starvation-inducible PsiE family protein [Gammaproteobacteria bacterium]|jgi:uncharacterized membrane protein (DUF373 family)|nr:phosphate-starvation-inducible PsiE family protein [Gammaproteobacteria bacterium]
MDQISARTITLVEKAKKLVTITLLLLMLIIVMVSAVELAVTAMSRKLILLDQKAYEPLEVIGFSAVIVALGLCYFLIKKSNRE